VFRKNVARRKGDLLWQPGYRVLKFETPHTAIIEHLKSKSTSRVGIRHLRWADPVAELVLNSELDVFPGESMLYISAEELPDLNWEAIEPGQPGQPVNREVERRIEQIVRDRSGDLTPQQPQPGSSDPSKRSRRTPRHLKDYYCGCAVSRTPGPKGALLKLRAELNHQIFSELAALRESRAERRERRDDRGSSRGAAGRDVDHRRRQSCHHRSLRPVTWRRSAPPKRLGSRRISDRRTM